MSLPFSKYSGSGNDFILIDNRKGIFPVHAKDLISHLCRRYGGIGADGVILLENSSSAHFRMRIFNADGTEAEMCGNGIRCLFRFICSLGYSELSYRIETMERCLNVCRCGDLISVAMGDPVDIRWNLSISNFNNLGPFHYLNTGVPHVVYFVDDVEKADMVLLGRELRYHEVFAPQGANINVVSVDDRGELWIRTYERGVEGETLACGTGATAAALAAAKIKGLRSPIKVNPRSRQVLEVSFLLEKDNFSQIMQTGPVSLVFTGNVLCCI